MLQYLVVETGNVEEGDLRMVLVALGAALDGILSR